MSSRPGYVEIIVTFHSVEFDRLVRYCERRNAARKDGIRISPEAVIESATLWRLDDVDAEISRGSK